MTLIADETLEYILTYIRDMASRGDGDAVAIERLVTQDKKEQCTHSVKGKGWERDTPHGHQPKVVEYCVDCWEDFPRKE
jgi:hypothetical protein